MTALGQLRSWSSASGVRSSSGNRAIISIALFELKAKKPAGCGRSFFVDGAAGFDSAIAAVRSGVPHAPERLHDEITADYNDMIYAETSQQIEARRKAFIRKWRGAVADNLEEAGARLFSFTRLPPEQWKSARTTNAIERLHEEFKRRIKTQTVLPSSAETAAMLFWALLASGQINMRKVDGWQTLAIKPIDQPIDLAA